MKKPAWIGEPTQEIEAIVAGRDWGDLDDRSWERIEALVRQRRESVVTESGEFVIHDTHERLSMRLRSRLWKARKERLASKALRPRIPPEGRFSRARRPQRHEVGSGATCPLMPISRS